MQMTCNTNIVSDNIPIKSFYLSASLIRKLAQMRSWRQD